MALQREQIDTLLAEIDGVLSKANPRLPWVMSSEVTQQRQTLERIRHYLKGLQSETAFSALGSSGYSPWPESVPTTNLEVSSQALIEQANSPQAALNLSQQMMQAFTQDLAQLRSSLLQPLHSETVRLQQQRDNLLQEIRQLERQRQQHTLIQQRASQEQQVYDFLQGLMDRLQERLSQQINQVVGTLAAQTRAGESVLMLDPNAGGSPLFPQEVGLPPLAPAQRVEQLQMLQARADQVMMTLDTTLRAFAEALQQNIQSYESSLSQGLEKMHSMGQQGEAIVANLVQKLADQVSGQVLSGTLPSLPASPGSRLQGFNAQTTGQNLAQTVGQGMGQGMSPGISQSTGSGLSPSQPLATYASPDSSANDRVTPRFGLPLSKPSRATTLGSSMVAGNLSRKSGDLGAAQQSTRETTDANADLDTLAWDEPQAELDLELNLLEESQVSTVEQSSSHPSGADQDLTSSSSPTSEGNEELDAFYASLFGDTSRKPDPVEPEPELAPAPEMALDKEETREIPDLELPDDLESFEDSGGSHQTIALENEDPFANLPSSEGVPEEDEILLDLELLDEESSASDTAPQDSAPQDSAPQDSALQDSGAVSQTNTPAPERSFGTAMDPLAALSLELQAPFQGVTELSAPSSNSSVTDSSAIDSSVTDPLMADLEEALQSLDTSPIMPPLGPPPVTTNLANRGTNLEIDLEINRGTANVTGVSPTPPQSLEESENIPPEDIITTLEDVLPWGGISQEPPSTPGATIASRDLITSQKPEVSLIPSPASGVSEKPQESQGLEDEIYHLAHPEETLLVKDEAEDEGQIHLQLEPETLQQLTEDLSNLERQPPVDSEDLFNLDGLGEGLEDRSEDSVPVADRFAEPQDRDFGIPETGSGLSEDVVEASSPEESLLPEAEDIGLDWLLEEPSVTTPVAYPPATTPITPPVTTPATPPVTPPVTSNVSFDLFAHSPFEPQLEEDLDLDSSFEEANELSLDRMTDWFGEVADTDTDSPSEEPFLIDHLFADLPDAEKKNDWNDWEP